jgi:hypothetical protein
MITDDILVFVGKYASLFCTTALGAGVGAYFGPYLNKKGQNLAKHEDLGKLVDEVKAVTEATKKIEREISVGLWDKQKRWEMKREVLFEAARRVSQIDDAMLSYSVIKKEDRARQKAWTAQKPSPEEEVTWGQAKNERLMKWSKASSEFDESRSWPSHAAKKRH